MPGLNNIEKDQKDPLRVFSDSVLLLRKQLGPWFEHFFREIPNEIACLFGKNSFISGMKRSWVSAHWWKKGAKTGYFARSIHPSRQRHTWVL